MGAGHRPGGGGGCKASRAKERMPAAERESPPTAACGGGVAGTLPPAHHHPATLLDGRWPSERRRKIRSPPLGMRATSGTGQSRAPAPQALESRRREKQWPNHPPGGVPPFPRIAAALRVWSESWVTSAALPVHHSLGANTPVWVWGGRSTLNCPTRGGTCARFVASTRCVRSSFFWAAKKSCGHRRAHVTPRLF